MGVANYYYTSNIQGKEVHYISADPSTISVANLNGAVLTSSSSTHFGINGTFFDGSTGNLAGIACVSGGSPVGTGGTSAVYTRGTMVKFRPNNGSTAYVSKFQCKDISDVGFPLSWLDWAISGLNLYLEDSAVTSETTLTKKLVDNEHGQSVNGVSPASNADRAAIGYKSSTGKVILANILNAKPWDVRQVMKYFNCDSAVMLDGSNATQLRAKKANGQIVTNGGGRNIYSVVTVNNATWQ